LLTRAEYDEVRKLQLRLFGAGLENAYANTTSHFSVVRLKESSRELEDAAIKFDNYLFSILEKPADQQK
jgi:hypothetical protein